jgi:hypothetical protein
MWKSCGNPNLTENGRKGACVSSKKANGTELAKVGFQYIGIPYSELDCQAFVEKCLSDCGIKKNLPGSNAWYREVAKNGWVGTPEECVAMYGTVPKGAFLFILKQDGGEPEKYKPDGIGNASHIGIVTGEGKGAIHSSSSRGCVCESEFHNKTVKNGGWNRVGLWNAVDYGTPEPSPTPEPIPCEFAVVYADNGLPVKMRAKPSASCRLYWEIPSGTTVLVLDHGTDWTKIEWNNICGYMLTRFLLFDGGTPHLYTVTIPHLSKSQADALCSQYPGSIMTAERG